VGVTVIPLVLRKVTLHPKLEELQYLDFSGDFNAPFKKLLRRLKNLEIKYLQKTLRHPQYAIRRHAARRLGELKVRKAIPDLIRVLENDRSHKVVRPAAADALEAIGTDEAIKAAEKYRGNN
jgi:HEAT repeat protein